ncbi:MAG: TaqI-like C-terminal specificity domain-containing protein [Methanothrix sp.]|nr:TaqI-like C-terminal specificity domain-containing protein [Methanothrix sp.]
MSPDSRPFRNSNLFSNHYLEKQVIESAEWREAEPEQAFARINDLYLRKARVLENYNESQLEENFIRPVLRILGHHFGVQGKVLGKDRTPDYAFFPDQVSLEEAEARPGEDYYRRAVAVGDAKSWKIQLDKSRKGQGSFEMQNPSFQIDVYLRDTPPKWAILTSGRLWRLYHETTSYKLDYYYEVDLPALLAAGDKENFKYFYLFFRREALPKLVDGDCFLDRVLEGSVAYAQEIGEDLQENVYRAMKILAEGFFAEAGNGLTLSEATVRVVQENALRLLYRLLFIFYAESRSLLDTNNRYYYELSLQKLKTEVAARLDRDEPLLSIRYSYGDGLKNLFCLINDGSESRRIPREEFYIPAYNGGLFDPVKNSFLEEARIGDSFLARAIDLLARSGQGPQKGFVDYSSLEIRHLGSIYEGLLEYRLRVAQQQMAAVKEKGKELWLPTGEAGKRKILDTAQAGEIFLATDKGERKATGSYYTPDYIVKYIVKNTIEPVVEKKKQEWLGTSRSFADYVLSIKVLDPAMGSGHFLVEATDQLARWLVHAWATARPEEDDSKEIAEQDIHWARREVVRNCIYGVDLNPMAVELAKLSLWLTTVASNKPLSFLDHHLRCGNSLIGAELDKLTVLPGGEKEQTPLWSYGLKSHTEGLLKRYSLMAALPDDNLQMVKWKEDQFRQIKESELSRRLAELSNVWLSTFFGNNVIDDDYYELQNHLSPEKFPDWAGLRVQEWFLRAQALAGEKRFFHWELEFPEAFQGDGRGFDVVIGNPPWVDIQELEDLDRSFQRLEFQSALGKYDQYALFIERGLELLARKGHLGEIIQSKFLVTDYGRGMRSMLAQKAQITQIVDMNDSQVFGSATTYPLMIFSTLSSDQSVSSFAEVIRFPSSRKVKAELSDLVLSLFRGDRPKNLQSFKISSENFRTSNPWRLESEEEKTLWSRVWKYSEPFVEHAKAINRSLTIGLNDAYVGSQEKWLSAGVEEDLIKPLVMARDLKRYVIDDGGQYIIFPYCSNANGELAQINLENYPGARRYFESIRNTLEARRWYGKTIIEAGMSWYSYLYISKFLLQPKLLFPKIASTTLFAFDETGEKILLEPAYIVIVGSDNSILYLMACLNSNLLTFRIRRETTTLSGGFMELQVQYVERLPIRRISFTTPAPERARLGAELQQFYADGEYAEVLAQVDSCLPKDEAGDFIASQEKSDVVHDLLAFLAERMLEMNKQKQQEIKGFLGWLEGYLGSKVEDLTPKTKLQSYYEHDYESFLAVLKKNRKKLAVDPARREPGEALKAEFEGSMGKLGPLLERIRQTDELIDAVVYRLYGLTEEEIGIVEAVH